jgi:hypothetical protein
LNSNAIAFAISGALLLVAALLWLRPRIGRRRQVRRFRKDLAHVDLMTVAWAQSMRDQHPSDDFWTPRPERRKDPEPDGDVPA